jgi:hypothetical protein
MGEDASRRYRSDATKRNMVWRLNQEVGAKFVGIVWRDLDCFNRPDVESGG